MKWFQKSLAKFFLLSVCILVMSCTSPQPQAVSEPKAFLSLYPAITETIYHLEAESKLVGRSDYCLFPSQAQNLPPFGSSLTPNLEAIAREKPDLVLLDESNGTPLEDLQRVVSVQQYPWLTEEEMRRSILQLGSLLDKEEAATTLASEIEKTFQSSVTSTSPSMLVLMEGSDIEKGQIWFMRHDSLHGSAIEAAGFRNAAPLDIKGPPQMSLEALLKQDPDMIVFMTASKVNSERVQTLIRSIDILPELKAVQRKRIGVLNGENLMGVGPGIVNLVQLIQDQGKILLERK